MLDENPRPPADEDRTAFVRAALGAGAEALRTTARDRTSEIAALGQAWAACLAAGGKILLMGNGGSHADAQHLAGELVNRFRRDRRALPALALATSAPVATAVANDDDFGRVFAREVEAFGAPGDLAVGLSTSGASPNVVAGLETARALGLKSQAFTGAAGGPVAEAADVVFRAPSGDTPIVQQVHLAVGHVLCDLVEAALFPDRA